MLITWCTSAGAGLVNWKCRVANECGKSAWILNIVSQRTQAWPYCNINTFLRNICDISELLHNTSCLIRSGCSTGHFNIKVFRKKCAQKVYNDWYRRGVHGSSGFETGYSNDVCSVRKRSQTQRPTNSRISSSSVELNVKKAAFHKWKIKSLA